MARFEKWSVTPKRIEGKVGVTSENEGYEFTKVENLGTTNISQENADLMNTHAHSSRIMYFAAPAEATAEETTEKPKGKGKSAVA